ncbi:hypothetical protein [Thermogymnomonas acidicola]|uniref:hypothetical protein n=1 Tax=Thermogymnomonas acidicola TaxID=399579 RepID=UPI001494D186|nr:hypothetical protein [Thermogymnomonas acidicola]
MFGGIYFITERVNIPLVWVNYTALKNAGIDSLPSNLTQLMTDAKILYQKYGVGMVNFQGHGGASTATELYQWMVQFGGNPLNFNDTGGDVNAIWYLANLSKYFSPRVQDILLGHIQGFGQQQVHNNGLPVAWFSQPYRTGHEACEPE